MKKRVWFITAFLTVLGGIVAQTIARKLLKERGKKGETHEISIQSESK